VYIERLLQINTATLAALANLLLGMGERSAVLPLAILLVALGSVWITDVAGWFRLNRPVTNLAALVAVLLALWELVSLRSSVQIFAIANLLIYLQVILLFQEKRFRTYCQLIALSLLQVVIAAAFNQGALFGVLLAVYLAAGLSAMMLLFLHRERSRYARQADGPSTPNTPRRWPLIDQTPVFTCSAAGLLGRAVLSRELWGRLGKIVVGTLAIAVVFFFIMPRLGNSAWRGPSRSLIRSVGFSDRVKLGELGRAIENRQEVLRIHFLDDARKPYQVHGELYLRGAVMTDYTRGEWQSYSHPGGERYSPLERNMLLPSETAVRQVITIEPMDRPEVFCVWPFVAATQEPDRRLLVDVQRQRLVRAAEYVGRQFTFELDTTAFVHGEQANLTPSEGRLRRNALLNLPPPETLPGLIALADEWLQQTDFAPDDRLQRARHLERMFAASGRFKYSLQGQPRDRALDPIEDFITKHPQGHCEYFATALVLMLRSQKIPARLVAGYKTDEWNPLGGFFQVRQLHAHTWVEVYLDPRHLPSELIRGERHWAWADGAWLRLDPTPGGDSEPTTAGHSLTKKMDRYVSWIEHLWDTYVVAMDSPRQREAIYHPTVEAVERTVKRLTDPAWWRNMLAGTVQWFRSKATRLGLWWLPVALVIAAGLLLVAYRWLGLAPRRLFGRLTGQTDRTKQSQRSKVEFYRRLEAVLARHGLNRAPEQTQREFAYEAGVALAAPSRLAELAPLPAQIADAFYRVRFGGLALDAAQAEMIETSLIRLERASQDER